MPGFEGGQYQAKDVRRARQRLGQSAKLAFRHRYSGSRAGNRAPDTASRHGGMLFSLDILNL
jgi:hypothetical protein